MKYETRFDFEQKVWSITMSQKQTWEICTFCGGAGVVLGQDDSEQQCPDCKTYRGSKKKYGDKIWNIDRLLTIGQIRIEVTAEYSDGVDSQFDNYGHQEAKCEEKYMCRETGIHTGTLHSVSDLFLTEEEARLECDSRNKESTDD